MQRLFNDISTSGIKVHQAADVDNRRATFNQITDWTQLCIDQPDGMDRPIPRHPKYWRRSATINRKLGLLFGQEMAFLAKILFDHLNRR